MDLRKFIVQAKINTYAAGGEGRENILEDGSKEFNFTKGGFQYRDRYFGSNPFIGKEIVWQGNKIIWGMNYYGSVKAGIIPAKEVYGFLKTAMQKVTEDRPFRGPNNFLQDGFEYIDKSEGDINLFKGVETIKFKGREVYKLYYHGGKMYNKIINYV